jgi:CheY-like chemotaxis protein
VQHFEAGRHDLILMDVQMPVMDGLRATAAIRRQPGGADVPIIAMTASAFLDDRNHCLAAGMDDFLGKPVEPEQLRSCLLTWLGPAAPPTPAAPASAEGGSRTMRTRLAAIGLDVAGAIDRLDGQWSLYRRMLHLFVDHHRDDARLLRQPDATPADLRQRAHAIAGAAGALGASQVTRQARTVEQLATVPADATTSPLRAQATALAQALDRLHDDLRQALGPESATGTDTPVAIDWPVVVQRLEAMGPLLADHDTSVSELYEESAAILEPALGGLARTLARLIGSFDFEAAQQLWTEALQQARDAVPEASK